MTKQSMTHEEVLSLLNKGYDMPRGWAKGEGQPLWHRKVVSMWRNMWLRCYDPTHKYYSNYIHVSIADEFKIFSNYLKWIQVQPRFDEFCSTCNEIKWSVDKDKNGEHYFPHTMILCTFSENNSERQLRCGNPMKDPTIAEKNGRARRKSVQAINIFDGSILIFESVNDAKDSGFNVAGIYKSLKDSSKTYKDYKWSYLD